MYNTLHVRTDTSATLDITFSEAVLERKKAAQSPTCAGLVVHAHAFA